MDGFDSSALPLHQHTPWAGQGEYNLDYMSVTSRTDLQDQYSNVDSDNYLSDDHFAFVPTGSALPHHASLSRYASTGSFDDTYPPTALPYVGHPHPDQVPDRAPGSQYLSFGPLTPTVRLLRQDRREATVHMHAELDGMFFMCEPPYAASPDTPPPAPELTCYRRNLFKLDGWIDIPHDLRYIWTDENASVPIKELELAVSAVESTEFNAVKLISVPEKSSTCGDSSPRQDTSEKEPLAVPLEWSKEERAPTDSNPFKFLWKRLQFRVATANNGRRKELQQHFLLRLHVMATVPSGQKMPIAVAESRPIIVRGRSPRNFATRKDTPIGNTSSSRRHMPAVGRHSSCQTIVAQITSAPMRSPSDAGSSVVFTPGGTGLLPSNYDSSSWQHNLSASKHLSSANYSPGATAELPMLYSQTSTPADTHPGYFRHLADLPTMGHSINLSVNSDEEGSPAPSRSRPSSRAPTSNPSPSLNNPPRSATAAQLDSPVQYAHSQKRPRLNSHEPVGMNVSEAGEPSLMFSPPMIGQPHLHLEPATLLYSQEWPSGPPSTAASEWQAHTVRGGCARTPSDDGQGIPNYWNHNVPRIQDYRHEEQPILNAYLATQSKYM